MASIAFDLTQLYRQTFGNKPYKVGKGESSPADSPYTINAKSELISTTGAPLTAKDVENVDIWLPIELYNLPNDVGENGRLKLYYATVNVTGSSSIVRTPLVERKGTVKELYSIDDYKITVKGFFIDKQTRSFPEKDIQALKLIHETGRTFSIWNALTDIILADTGNPTFEQQQVIMSSFSLPDVEGGKKSMRPFIMSLESDEVFTLEVE